MPKVARMMQGLHFLFVKFKEIFNSFEQKHPLYEMINYVEQICYRELEEIQWIKN